VTIFVAVPANAVDVPLVTDLDEEAAKASLTALGLVPEVQTGDSEKAGGIVYDQNPAAGTSVEPGSKVVIYVSNTPTTVSVPSCKGFKLSVAQSKLTAAGLGWTLVYEETTEAAANTVIDQSPSAGKTVALGSKVTLTVAKTPSATTTTTVPAPTTTAAPSTTTTT
jgi:eukaryotic-like serine/threonine-protein kinase